MKIRILIRMGALIGKEVLINKNTERALNRIITVHVFNASVKSNPVLYWFVVFHYFLLKLV